LVSELRRAVAQETAGKPEHSGGEDKMDGRYRRSERFVVVVGVTAALLGSALLSDGFSAFRTEPRSLTLSGPAAQLHETVNAIEERLPAGRSESDGRWRGYVDTVEWHLEQRDVSGAVRAWHDAHAAALESRSWQAMLEVGDAALEIGRLSGSGAASHATATDAYLVALIRARRDGALDGAFRVAEAFDALSNRTAVNQSLRVADRLAAERGDAGGRERARRWLSQVHGPIVSTTEP
jgi:hypothetical protein